MYKYLGVGIPKDCSWGAHIPKVIGKARAHVGKMVAVQTDSAHDTRNNICILMSVIVPKLEYAGGVWEGVGKLVNQPATVRITAAKIDQGYSGTKNTVVRAELGTCLLERTET